MANDSLARGDKSAQFRVGGSNLSELQWHLAVLTEAEFLAQHPELTRERYLELVDELNRGNA